MIFFSLLFADLAVDEFLLNFVHRLFVIQELKEKLPLLKILSIKYHLGEINLHQIEYDSKIPIQKITMISTGRSPITSIPLTLFDILENIEELTFAGEGFELKNIPEMLHKIDQLKKEKKLENFKYLILKNLGISREKESWLKKLINWVNGKSQKTSQPMSLEDSQRIEQRHGFKVCYQNESKNNS